MPSIVAVPYPDRGHVLLEVSFADVPGATNVCVEAVTGLGTDDEARRPLHAYVLYNESGCLALSCGQGILWDTEAPCGTEVVYCATGSDAAGNVLTTAADPLALDTFTRVVASAWGTPDVGPAWLVVGGTAPDYSVNGTRGQHAVPSTGVSRTSRLAMGNPNTTVQVTAFPSAVATGGMFQQTVRMRSTSFNNFYEAVLAFQTTGQMDLTFRRLNAGTPTVINSTASFMPYSATTQVAVKMRAWGNQLQLTVWDQTAPEPVAPTYTATDASITSGSFIELTSLRGAANTNVTLVTQWDNLSVLDVCIALKVVESCSNPVTLACDGCFRLGDPVRPCNDVRICLCGEEVECGGTGGISFIGMLPDSYDDNSGNMLPVNGVYPIHISRNRRAADGTFLVTPASFVDRDNLLRLLAPGGALLWRGPAEYGIGDRYLAILSVPVAPGIADLSIQTRAMQLPFLVTKAVVGPSQGVCGSRVQDLCDLYGTWDELIAAGLTYADLIRGEASGTGSGLWTWNDVNANNVDWAALQATETDWADVVDGD